MEMNQNKIEANAGDNSCQIQAKQVIINNGCTSEEVRRIAKDTFEISKREFTQDAYEIANKRVNKLTDSLILRIERLENTMEAFREPAFQKSYVRAQQAAACTDQKSDYEILADLLVRRMINNKEDRYDKVAVDAAIQVVDKVAEDALLGLTVSLILMLFSPRKLLSDFDRLNKYLSLLPLDDLPNDRRWISHLSTLGLIQYDFGKTYGQEHYSSMFLKKSPMYANCGIATKEFPDDIYERLEKAKIVQFISNSILVPHELHPNYLRMNVRNGEKDLEDLIEGLAIQGDKKQISNALRYIYNCYFSDRKIDKEVEENLQKEIAKRKYLLKAVEWWDKREQYFYTREPGIALAYANMRRFDPIFDLANWL